LREINDLDHIRHLLLAACDASLGHSEAARGHARALITKMPDLTLDRIGLFRSFRQPQHGLKLREALNKAGLPEG
jgi:hypothetical protein